MNIFKNNNVMITRILDSKMEGVILIPNNQSKELTRRNSAISNPLKLSKSVLGGVL